MTIWTQQQGNRTCYLTDTQAEWEDLTNKSQVVFTMQESQLFQTHPKILDEDIRVLLLRLKMFIPKTLILGVEETT